jgi:hypothetical protein
MLRLVSLICLLLIATFRLVGSLTNAPVIQIQDDLVDSRTHVAQAAGSTGCEGTFLSDLGDRKQNTTSAIHLGREALSGISRLTTRDGPSRGVDPAKVNVRTTQNRKDEQTFLRRADRSLWLTANGRLALRNSTLHRALLESEFCAGK